MKAKKKNLFSTFLKIGITIFLLYLVSTKIPLIEIWDTLKQANPMLLISASLLFILSQCISAQRLFILFNSVRFFLNPISNYSLYLLGMFYNFFIPGGIGGDAYKVYTLNKEFGWSIKTLSSAIFVDRFMGLTAIGVLILCFSFFMPYFYEKNLILLIVILLILGLIVSYIIVKKWFFNFLKVYPKTLMQSLVVQSLQCATVIALLASISNFDNYILYLLVFLITSILSIFSFSGIGIREIIFYQASTWFLFDSTTAVTVGILFSSLTAFVSLFGLVFHFKKTASYIKTVPL